MSMAIECFEDWGVATGSPPRGTNRTKVTNCNLKTWVDPEQNYYLNDLQRPTSGQSSTYTRWFSWKITGTFSRIKNVRIYIPQGHVAGNWQVAYGLRTNYVEPASETNEFGFPVGAFDSSLAVLTSEATLYPNLSTVGPQEATTRLLSYTDSAAVWTQYLVLQFTAFPSTFDDVNNFGTGYVRLLVDELEI